MIAGILAVLLLSIPEYHKSIPVEENKVAEIEEIISDSTVCFAPAYSNRERWERALPKGSKTYNKIISTADSYLKADGSCTLEEWQPDYIDKYFEIIFSKHDTNTGKLMMNKRLDFITNLAIAECLTNENKYTSAYEDAIRKNIRQPLWCYPAHYKPGKTKGVELYSQNIAELIAMTLYMMGDKVDAGLRKEAVDSLYSKVFYPAMDLSAIGAVNKKNNWNPVVLCGVVNAAMAIMGDKTDRARIAYIAQRYINNYLCGYTPDGYCTEGMSYYSYGMSHYVTLREILLKATGGRMDIFKDNPYLKEMMLYPLNMQMYSDLPCNENCFASIGDCHSNQHPNPIIMHYNSQYLGLGLKEYRKHGQDKKLAFLSMAMMYLFDNCHWSGASCKSGIDQLRSCFDSTGIVSFRPKETDSYRMAVTIKGGHNREAHNHNDIGTYNICVGGTFLVEDPGIAPYTAITHKAASRYTIKTISSYGHPVPAIDDSLQTQYGKRVQVLEKSWSDNTDRYALELSPFYKERIPDLKSIKRICIYSRVSPASFTVKDEFVAGSAHKYESAIITRGAIDNLSDKGFTISRDGKTIQVTIESSGPVRISTETIGGTKYESKEPFTRISVALSKNTRKAYINVLYSEPRQK